MNRYHTIFAPFSSLPSTRGRVVRDSKEPEGNWRIT
jgi:hypothetical protein